LADELLDAEALQPYRDSVMPTYEYECSKCGHEFEKFQPISDSAITTCPKELCARKPWAKGKVKRKIGAGAGLIFKGSGFYITDYRSENYKQSAKKESGESKPAESKTSESKPAESKGVPAAKPAPRAESKPTKKSTD
jgi:putative FmdB family regulatory protein